MFLLNAQTCIITDLFCCKYHSFDSPSLDVRPCNAEQLASRHCYNGGSCIEEDGDVLCRQVEEPGKLGCRWTVRRYNPVSFRCMPSFEGSYCENYSPGQLPKCKPMTQGFPILSRVSCFRNVLFLVPRTFPT